MVKQVMNRRFVMQQLDDMKDFLENPQKYDSTRRDGVKIPEDAENLEKEDFDNALESVNESIANEEKISSGQEGFDDYSPEARRRGEEPPSIDDYAFFSRDPVISNLQSALEDYFENNKPEDVEDVKTGHGGRRSGGDEILPAADKSIKNINLEVTDDGRRLFNKYSITDPGWIKSVFAMGVRLLKKKHRFVENPAIPKPIANRTRIILFGDWGSGLPRAQKVASQVRKILDEGKARGIQQHVVHLGDIYYSGWKREVKNNFLKYWPVAMGEANEISSWSVNANHDMYAGGHAYYKTLLKDPRFAGHVNSDGDTTSIFSMLNDKWRILGVDSAHDDHNLKEPQPQWIRAQVAEAKQAGQKVMLLCHHQLFSAFEDGGNDMVTALGDLLEGPNIHSWFWGHEHRCAVYKPHMNIQYARLLGHGGVPAYQWKKQKDDIPEMTNYVYRGRFKSGLEQWGYFGFAVLDFDDTNIGVRYIDENGETHYSETIT